MEKIAFLNFKRIQNVLTKTIPLIWMFLNQIHVVKMKNEIVEVLSTQSLLLVDKNLDLDTLLVEMEKRVEVMTLSLSLEVEDNSLEKAMEPLLGLSDLSSLRTWVNLAQNGS